MLSFNEKFILLKALQEKDQFGSIIQTMQILGEHWCSVVESKGFFKDSKGGKKRVQTLVLATWLNRDINHEYFVTYNGVQYNVVNAIHSRTKGITTIQCEFNN